MNFEKAMNEMLIGNKVRRKGWNGYWFANKSQIMIAYLWFKGIKENESLVTINLNETEDMFGTLIHTQFDDWEIVNEES